jgi:small subunit ribosomal protein S14
MAKTSIIAREIKRERLVEKHKAKRAMLKEAALKGDSEAQVALDKMPMNSSKVRLHNRCKLTGRPKGYMRQFGVCRNQFRELALYGKIPGIKKASW